MNADFDSSRRGDIHGHVLHLDGGRHIAIYSRHGLPWVADFDDGRGELMDATLWFRFECAALANSHAMRAMALESAVPISPEFGERIEALHGIASSRRGRGPIDLIKAIATHVRRSRLAMLLAFRFRRPNSHRASSTR